MTDELTNIVAGVGKRMMYYALAINFLIYGFRVFLTTLKAKKGKVEHVELNNSKQRPPATITILVSVLASCAFAFLLEKWAPFNVWRYILYCITLFLIQTGTYRSAVKSILELIPKLTKKFLGA